MTSNPTPFFGTAAHQSNLSSTSHQHYFSYAGTTLSINTGDVLVAYVYLDAANPPLEVMLQWNNGDWEHRAYWGASLDTYGVEGTASRRYMGPLPAAGIALIPTIVFGCLYFPMAFLAVAIKDNVFASNPLVVVPSILRVPLEYIVAAILLAGMFGVRWLGDAISGEMGHRALRTESISEMLLLFGLRMLWAFLSVYLLTVTMRILGLLYLTKRDRLGW